MSKHSDTQRVSQAEHARCANCDIEILWHPTVVQDRSYCCTGCAAGGPCDCDYSLYRVLNVKGSTDINTHAGATETHAPMPGQEPGSDKHVSQKEGEYTVASIRPVGDRVVVKPAAKEDVTKSGIVIPDTAKEKPQEGTVVAVGSGRLLDNGDRAAVDLREGDHVLFAKYGGTEFKLDGEEYLVLKESDILAIIA